jgi:signal transduction histidine kinase
MPRQPCASYGDAVTVGSFVQRWGDLLIAGALALGSAGEVVAYPRAALPLAAVVAAVTGLGFALRQRLPLVVFILDVAGTAAVVGLAPGFIRHSVVMIVAFMLALYSLGRHARGVEAWFGPPAVVLAAVILEMQDTDVSLNGVLFYLLFAGLPWGAGLAIRLRIDRVRELRARNAALQEEARRAVTDERARIARELHDVVSHAIAVTVLQARGSRKLVGRDDDAVRQALTAIEGTNTAALSDMRRLLSLLRETESGADDIEPAPTLDRIADLVEQVRAAGVTVDLVVEGERLPLTPGVDLSGYRIVQEALTNVVKHGGPGASAQVRVHYGPDRLELEVRSTMSDGSPVLAGTRGHGLVGIRERVAVVGGTAEAGPSAEGWRVAAAMPYLVGS